MALAVSIGGSAGPNDAFKWQIDYDDATRAVTTIATGTGFAFVQVQITAAITRTVAYLPAPGAVSNHAALAAEMATADFTVVVDGTTHTLVTGINPNQVTKIIGKAGSGAAFPNSSQWAPS